MRGGFPPQPPGRDPERPSFKFAARPDAAPKQGGRGLLRLRRLSPPLPGRGVGPARAPSTPKPGGVRRRPAKRSPPPSDSRGPPAGGRT